MIYDNWDMFGAACPCGIGFESRHARAVALRTPGGKRLVRAAGNGGGGLERWMTGAMLEYGRLGRCVAWRLEELVIRLTPLVLPLGGLGFAVQLSLRLAAFLLLSALAKALFPERRRWHGAENQVLNALRDGRVMSVGAAMREPVLLDTCGTVDGFWVNFAGIAAASLIHTPWAVVDALAAIVAASVLQVLLERCWERIVPLRRERRGLIAGALVRVGLWYQRLCVAAPRQYEIEDALEALRAVQDREKARRRKR